MALTRPLLVVVSVCMSTAAGKLQVKAEKNQYRQYKKQGTVMYRGVIKSSLNNMCALVALVTSTCTCTL